MDKKAADEADHRTACSHQPGMRSALPPATAAPLVLRLPPCGWGEQWQGSAPDTGERLA